MLVILQQLRKFGTQATQARSLHCSALARAPLPAADCSASCVAHRCRAAQLRLQVGGHGRIHGTHHQPAQQGGEEGRWKGGGSGGRGCWPQPCRGAPPRHFSARQEAPDVRGRPAGRHRRRNWPRPPRSWPTDLWARRCRAWKLCCEGRAATGAAMAAATTIGVWLRASGSEVGASAAVVCKCGDATVQCA